MASQISNSIKENLQNVLQEKAPLNVSLIEKLINKLNLDTSLQANDTAPLALVPLLLQCIRTPLAIDYAELVRLLQAIFERRPFDEILTLISEADFLEALNSDNIHLQKLCLTQLKRSPVDFLAASDLIPCMLKLYSSGDTDSSIVNELSKTIISLGEAGDMIRKRLFTEQGECVKLLYALHDGNGIQQGRLMALIEGLFPYDTSLYVPDDLIQFSPQSISDSCDVLLVMNKIQMYKQLIVNSHCPRLIEIISEQVKAICDLFKKRETNEDVKMFLLNEIINFFGALSRVYPSAFSDVDKYIDLASSGYLTEYSNNRCLTVLATLDPNYLYQAHKDAIKNIPFKAATLIPFRNIYKSRQAYELNRPSSEKILELPYLEQMFILVAITSTSWGTSDLLHHWPRVMESLLSHEGIRDKDTQSFRKETIENLLLNPSDVLSVWFNRLRQAYSEIIHGFPSVNDPEILIADDSQQ